MFIKKDVNVQNLVAKKNIVNVILMELDVVVNVNVKIVRILKP